jgi:hypothetical protein
LIVLQGIIFFVFRVTNIKYDGIFGIEFAVCTSGII